MKLNRNKSLGQALILTLFSGTLLFGQCTGSSTSRTCTSTGGATTLTSTPSTGGGDFPQPATVFPINNAVSGMTGTITSISVRLNGLSHTDPDDLDMMLVSPDGTAFVFWSDIGGVRTTFDQTQPPAAPGGTNVCRTQTAGGGACSISNFTITIADNGATRLPDGRVFAGGDTRVLVNNTTYQPANGGTGIDDFSNLNPSFSSGVTLTAANFAQDTTSTGAGQLGGTATFANRFNGSSNVNGVWKLYIVMDACCFTDGNGQSNNDIGSLTSWSLIITTAANNAATTTSLLSNNNPSLLPNNNSVTFTASVTAGGNPVTLGTVDFANAGIPFVTGVALNASGQASTTVTNLTERIHAITAVYSGATGFATSTGSLSQTVNRATTRTGNTFCNTGPIAIPANFSPSPASTPYPSNLFVTGLTGNISKVTLDLKNFNLTAPSDADVLLVAPTGQKFIPFSYIGGTSPAAANVNLTLDDAAASALPSSGGVTSGTYRPTVHNTFQVSFPSPAPAGPHTSAAPSGTATFANTFGTLNPIGTWQLFVSTHGGTNAVSNFNGGWCLTFTTSGDPASTTTPSVNPSPSAVDQNVTVSALVTNATTGTPVGALGSVSFFENSTPLGGGPLALISNGTASFSNSAFTQGAHFFDANYSGSPGAFNLSTGRVLHYVDAPTTNPSAGQFCNTSLVTFPNVIGASGNPYPTRVNVSGLAGTLTKATLTLTNLSHNFPKDMDMMLSGPNGNSLVVLSDVGGLSPLTTPVTLVLDSTVGTSLPASSALTSGTFRPNDFADGTDTFAPPAPTTNRFLASPTVGFQDAFSNINPNGIWTLWTTNDGAGGSGGGTLAGGWCLNLTMTPPQLTISKTHSGNFSQGQTGAQYTVVVGNSGPGSTVGTITVVDTVPTGLTITSMSGQGWTCTVNTRTCTTTASIPANGTLPPITVLVNVSQNATSPLVNSVSVSGGGATGATATDSTIITAVADLTVSKTTSSTFVQGGTATYSIIVTNSGAGPSTGNIIVSDNMPTGLTITSTSGAGWDCTASTSTFLNCVRTTTLNAGTFAPGIVVNVNIASNTATSITNTASVAGGGEVNTSNNTGSVTNSVSAAPPDLTVTKTVVSTAPIVRGGQVTFRVQVTNTGSGPTTGSWTLIDNAPTGITFVTLSGGLTTCGGSTTTITCTQSTVIPAGGNISVDILANIAPTAPASITNTASVSGGGETNTSNNAGTATINPVDPPDLTVTKIAVGTFQQGGSASYTVTVTNSGTGSTLIPYTITDNLPSGLTAGLVTSSDPGWNCTASTSTVVSCTRSNTLAPTASSSISIPVTFATNTASTVTNTAFVTGGGEIVTNNNAGSAVTGVTQTAPDLTVTKIAQGGPFQQGGTVSYQITVTNGGNGPTTSTITMSDTIPTGLTVTSVSGGADWVCINAQPVTCSRTNPLAAGANSVITLSANIASNAPTSITNTATVVTTGESNSGNNANSSVISVTQLAPDLTVTKVAQGGPFQQGGTVTYLITVTNGGNGPTTSTITMSDTIPTGLTVSSVSGGADWVCINAQPVTCSRATPLAAGANSVITLSANIASNASTSITNTATVATTGESNSGNNAGSSVISVATVAPDLTVTKVAQGGPFQQGGTVTYQITVTNGGNGPTTAIITMSDTIPTGLAVTNVSGDSGWTCINAQPVTCSRATPLAAGANSVITLSANIASNAPTSITNTATVATSGESNSGNNANSSVISVTTIAPDLTVTKVAQGGPFQQGGTVTYLITVTNGGNGPTTGTISMSDTIPTGLTVTSVSGDTGWTCTNAQPVTCNRNTALAAAASTVITLTANIASNAPATILNTATVSTAGESNSGNNANSSLISVGPALTPVTINVPAGVSYSFNSLAATGSQTFNVAPGSYTLTTTSPQQLGSGVRAVWSSWSNAQPISHSVTVASSPISITGNFTIQYQLTTAASPTNGGTVTPPTGNYYDSGTVVSVSATPNSGFTFANWTGPVANASAAATTVTMSAPIAITANFSSQTGVTVNVPAGVTYSFNGQTVTGSQTFNVAPGTYLLSTTSPQTIAPGTRAVWSSWSNAQPISHNVVVGSSPISITGNFTTQFQLTTAASPTNGGNVTPASGFFDSGTVVNVTATPNSGFTFANWTGPVANASSAATTVTMDAAKSVTASFSPSVSPNVTSQLTVILGVPTFNRATGRFSQTVTVTNNGAALSAAAYVLDSLAAGFSVFNPSGFTSAASPAGSPYREIGSIGAGASVTFAVEFTRVGTPALTYTPRVLGPGTR